MTDQYPVKLKMPVFYHLAISFLSVYPIETVTCTRQHENECPEKHCLENHELENHLTSTSRLKWERMGPILKRGYFHPWKLTRARGSYMIAS